MVVRAHGGAEMLALENDFPDPVAGAGDVVLQVRAASLNYHDVFTRRGMPGIKIPLPVIMGLDVAGEILSVGPDVEGWRIGERVLVDPINRIEGGLMGETTHGGLAELCRARAHQLIKIPDGVSFSDAAALPVAYGTALRMMVTNGGVKAGDKVLILGASGGVGVCCVQLAKLAGAEVVACAGTDEKAARLRDLGADHTINYTTHDFVKEAWALHGKPARRGVHSGRGFDMVVNYTGDDTWVKSMRVLKVGGKRRLALSPFIAFLNMTVIEADPAAQRVSMTIPMRAEFERGAGSGQWHGGPLAAIIDTVGDYALIIALGRPLPTVNFRVDYLKPAVTPTLTATATVRRAGKSVGVVDVDLFDARGALVAIGRATYSTLPA
jgi:alcohol dehydrogenase